MCRCRSPFAAWRDGRGRAAMFRLGRGQGLQILLLVRRKQGEHLGVRCLVQLARLGAKGMQLLRLLF